MQGNSWMRQADLKNACGMWRIEMSRENNKKDKINIKRSLKAAT